jgi:hypothetical protein
LGARPRASPCGAGDRRTRRSFGLVRAYLTVRTDLTICSFCRKSEDEVQKLAAGPSGIFICDECVDVCRAIMQGEEACMSRAFDPRTWTEERLLPLLGPLSATADAYRDHLQAIVDTLRRKGLSWGAIAKSLAFPAKALGNAFREYALPSPALPAAPQHFTRR